MPFSTARANLNRPCTIRGGHLPSSIGLLVRTLPAVLQGNEN